MPESPYPEHPDPKRLLDEELRGPVDPRVAKELGDLMRKKRPIPLSDNGSLSSHGELTSGKPTPDAAALYGPASRNNESIRLGEGLTKPNVIVLDDDDDGFEAVLDLYRGAIQGSSLSRELELTVWGDDGLTGAGWEDASSLGISVKHNSAAPSSSGDSQESYIRSLAGYKQVIREENAKPPSSAAVAPCEEPPLGIRWSYSCCGYATGSVVNAQKARPQRRPRIL